MSDNDDCGKSRRRCLMGTRSYFTPPSLFAEEITCRSASYPPTVPANGADRGKWPNSSGPTTKHPAGNCHRLGVHRRRLIRSTLTAGKKMILAKVGNRHLPEIWRISAQNSVDLGNTNSRWIARVGQ